MLRSKSITVMYYDAKRPKYLAKSLNKLPFGEKQLNKVQLHSLIRRLGVKIVVEYFGYIKQTLSVAHPETIEIQSGTTARNLLVQLAEKHGEPFKKAVYDPKDPDSLKPYHILAVNGLMIDLLNGLDTKLKDGDRVAVMPVVTGG